MQSCLPFFDWHGFEPRCSNSLHSWYTSASVRVSSYQPVRVSSRGECFFFFFCVRSKILCVQMFAWNCWRMRQTGHCGRMKMTRLEFILEQERLPLGCWKELKKDWYFGSRGRTVSCSLATPRKTIERFNMLKSCYSEGTHAPTLESLPLMYNHTCACLPLTQAQYICRDKVTAVYDPFCRGRVLLS